MTKATTTAARDQLREAAQQAQVDLDDLRDRIADLKRQRRETDAAPRRFEDVADEIDLHIKDAQSNPSSHITDAALSGGGFSPHNFDQAFQRDPFAVLALCFPQALRDGLTTTLRPHCEGGLSEGDRAANLRELEDLIHETERAEECAVRELEAIGMTPRRREDANPALVLAPDHEIGFNGE